MSLLHAVSSLLLSNENIKKKNLHVLKKSKVFIGYLFGVSEANDNNETSGACAYDLQQLEDKIIKSD